MEKAILIHVDEDGIVKFCTASPEQVDTWSEADDHGEKFFGRWQDPPSGKFAAKARELVRQAFTPPKF